MKQANELRGLERRVHVLGVEDDHLLDDVEVGSFAVAANVVDLARSAAQERVQLCLLNYARGVAGLTVAMRRRRPSYLKLVWA